MEEFIPGSDNKQDNIPTFPKATCNIPWMGMNHGRPLGGENPHRPCCHRHFTADKMTLLLVTLLQILWHTSAQKTLIICLWWKVKHPASSFEVINTSSVQETFQGLSKFNKVSELLDNNQSQPGFFVQFSLPFFKGLMLLYFDPSHLKPLVFNWQLLAFPISVSNTFTNWCIVW